MVKADMPSGALVSASHSIVLIRPLTLPKTIYYLARY